MSTRFRPTVEQLDSRDLMSVTVGFVLPSGDVASGSFNLATSQIDPNAASQSIAITDLDFEVDDWYLFSAPPAGWGVAGFGCRTTATSG